MKSTLAFLLLAAVLAAPARANFGVAAKSPVAVTYDPKTITAGDSVDSIQKAFANSAKTETVDPKTGNTIVTLTNGSEGSTAASAQYKVETYTQLTTLTLVVGKDGKIASYDMEQDVISYGHVDSSRDMGAACFSDCGNSAASIVAAKNEAKTPEKSIPSTTDADKTDSTQTSNPKQEQQTTVSPSAP